MVTRKEDKRRAKQKEKGSANKGRKKSEEEGDKDGKCMKVRILCTHTYVL